MKLLKDIGEFALIERIKNRVSTGSGCIRGIGDDTAVLSLNKKEFMLWTADMLVEGVHFKKDDDPKAIGRKAISVSISDIAAMAGVPVYALISIGLPATTALSKIERIYTGVIERAKEFKINIVGGDTVRCEQAVINISLIGKVEKKNLVTRIGARRNDIIFVTGGLGASRKKNRHLNFTPPLKESRFLVKRFHINSMIDLSDGLFSDLMKICKENKVGAVIYEELIPLNTGANLTRALYDGEDFKLLFTAGIDVARQISRACDFKFFAIGHIRDRKFGLKLVKKGVRRKEVRLSDKSFRHFR